MDLIEYFKTNPSLVKKFQKKENQQKQKEEVETDNKSLKKNTKRKIKKKKKRKKENNKKNDENNNGERNIISEFKRKNNASLINRIIEPNINKNDEINDSENNPDEKKDCSKEDLKSLPNNNIIRFNKGRNKKKQKKRNIINNNINNNDNNVINIIQTRNDQNIIVNKGDFPYGMNEKELYEIFCKINNKTDSELNDLDDEKAIIFDNRTFYLYYVSLVRTNHLIFFSFWPRFDFNSRIMKIFLFFFNFTTSLTINSLFFNDETMHKIFKEKGEFNFVYNLPQIIYSSIISAVINALIKTLALTNSILYT